MSESELRFRRTVKRGNKEESVDLLTLATTRNAEYNKENFPDFLDLIYYVKQILALVIGVTWGIIPMTGMLGIVSGLVAIFGICLLYTNRFLCVDSEDYDIMAIIGEGAMPTICLFMTFWIFVYSTFHF